MATTAVRGLHVFEQLSAHDVVRLAEEALGEEHRLALVFGRERWGLTGAQREGARRSNAPTGTVRFGRPKTDRIALLPIDRSALKRQTLRRYAPQSELPVGITFFRSAARGLHVPNRLTRESAEHEGFSPGSTNGRASAAAKSWPAATAAATKALPRRRTLIRPA